jgi:hypothetical protein
MVAAIVCVAAGGMCVGVERLVGPGIVFVKVDEAVAVELGRLPLHPASRITITMKTRS